MNTKHIVVIPLTIADSITSHARSLNPLVQFPRAGETITSVRAEKFAGVFRDQLSSLKSDIAVTKTMTASQTTAKSVKWVEVSCNSQILSVAMLGS